MICRRSATHICIHLQLFDCRKLLHEWQRWPLKLGWAAQMGLLPRQGKAPNGCEAKVLDS